MEEAAILQEGGPFIVGRSRYAAEKNELPSRQRTEKGSSLPLNLNKFERGTTVDGNSYLISSKGHPKT